MLQQYIHLLDSPTGRYSLGISAQLIWGEQAHGIVVVIIIILSNTYCVFICA